MLEKETEAFIESDTFSVMDVIYGLSYYDNLDTILWK